MASAGGENGGPWFGGLGRNVRAMAWSPFTARKMRAPIALTTRADLEALTGVTPAIDRTYPLAEAPAAMRRLADGQACGKVILVV